MRIRPKNYYVRKFQDGGAVNNGTTPDEGTTGAAPEEVGGGAPEQGAPEQGAAPQQPQDPIMMIAQAAAQALQTNDCQLALQVCQAFLQVLQQMQGGGGGAPTQGAPVYRRGGKLAYRIRK